MSALQKLKAYFGMVPADEHGYDDEYDDYDDRYDRAPARSRERYRDRPDPTEPAYDAYDEPAARMRSRSSVAAEPSTHGALAVDRQPEPVARLRPVTEPVAPPVRDPLSRITTLHPTSYLEARAIGEHYREGIPVIINLTEMENADAKRIVDFAAGLAFAVRGSMDKVTNKVFLLSPPDVDVTAEDRRRIAEGGLFLRG
ncbi:cell division protein SepF [Amycolatopsis jejuensis]|uniref:cell division protein SepF n=1 Tax=Amycolatopsis jejuensis TaxID=330084 RepID=UPI000524CCF5|nr:cell division protein SepF [Amycolatopsis jejuensis]